MRARRENHSTCGVCRSWAVLCCVGVSRVARAALEVGLRSFRSLPWVRRKQPSTVDLEKIPNYIFFMRECIYLLLNALRPVRRFSSQCSPRSRSQQLPLQAYTRHSMFGARAVPWSALLWLAATLAVVVLAPPVAAYYGVAVLYAQPGGPVPNADCI